MSIYVISSYNEDHVGGMTLMSSNDEMTATSESKQIFTDSPWVQFKIPNVAPSQERMEAIYEDLCYVHVPAVGQEVLGRSDLFVDALMFHVRFVE